jgi:hypothetical protein
MNEAKAPKLLGPLPIIGQSLLFIVTGSALGVLLSLLESSKSGEPNRMDVSSVVVLGLALVAQCAFVWTLLRVLSRTQASPRIPSLFRVVTIAFHVGNGVVAFLCVASFLFARLDENVMVEVCIWFGLSTSLTLAASRIAASGWTGKPTLRREISNYLIVTSVLTLIALLAMLILAIESVSGNRGAFSQVVATTALLAASIMSVPAAVWIMFILGQSDEPNGPPAQSRPTDLARELPRRSSNRASERGSRQRGPLSVRRSRVLKLLQPRETWDFGQRQTLRTRSWRRQK